MVELENIYNLYIWGIVVLVENHLGGESGGTCQVTRYAKQQAGNFDSGPGTSSCVHDWPCQNFYAFSGRISYNVVGAFRQADFVYVCDGRH